MFCIHIHPIIYVVNSDIYIYIYIYIYILKYTFLILVHDLYISHTCNDIKENKRRRIESLKLKSMPNI